MPRGQRHRSESDIELTARPGNEPIVIEANPQTTQRNFKACVGVGVAHEQIRDPQGVLIERAAHGNAKFAKTDSTQILHAR
jgi:hypothetical protein